MCCNYRTISPLDCSVVAGQCHLHVEELPQSTLRCFHETCPISHSTLQNAISNGRLIHLENKQNEEPATLLPCSAFGAHSTGVRREERGE